MTSSLLSHDDAAPDGPLLFGRILDGQGGAKSLTWAEAEHWAPSKKGEVIWLHLLRTEPGVQAWLESLGVGEPTAELLVSDSSRPRVMWEGNTLVATLRGINFNPGAEPEDMVSMQVWSDGVRVVTLRRHRLQSPRDVQERLDAGTGPVDASRVVTDLVEAMTYRMNAAIIDMNDAIDELEAMDADDEAGEVLARIATIRRNCLGLQRHMAPQHEALEMMGRGAPDWFGVDSRREIVESIERLRRYLEDINISKESAMVLQDDIRARSAARAERTNYLLTLVAAVFLPLSFITGLLGINVGGMPGVDSSDAFWIVAGLCGAVLVMQVALFWRWKWL